MTTPISQSHCPPSVPCPNPITRSYALKDLDGRADTGAFRFFNTAQGDFTTFNSSLNLQELRVSSLLGEDNKVSTSAWDVYKTSGDRFVPGNDWGLVGDPFLIREENNYAQEKLSGVKNGFITMWETGADNGRKVTINSHYDTINKEGNQAFTQYGAVFQSEEGGKASLSLIGGQAKITANGQSLTLDPTQQTAQNPVVLGNPSDPVGKVYYAPRPGGADGKTETRLVVEMFEKPSAATIQDLVSKGVPRAEAEKMRLKKEANFGFRVPDGKNTYAKPAGVGTGSPQTTTANGVKTYYDAHFVNNETLTIDGKECPPPSHPTPAPTPQHPVPTPTPQHPTPTPTPQHPAPTTPQAPDCPPPVAHKPRPTPQSGKPSKPVKPPVSHRPTTPKAPVSHKPNPQGAQDCPPSADHLSKKDLIAQLAPAFQSGDPMAVIQVLLKALGLN